MHRRQAWQFAGLTTYVCFHPCIQALSLPIADSEARSSGASFLISKTP
jgi:hypothetical protein